MKKSRKSINEPPQQCINIIKKRKTEVYKQVNIIFTYFNKQSNQLENVIKLI